ncbi:MAG TPA: MFS transporter [Burkholderiaceae bacterium]|nr:MFS transporter [Burkholderiaceae bacterium]HPE02500.1 MFS transporter [Burkholderiaceae bacterium]HRZ00248.1 MFS transporter [Burkholderiaceae bacterium]
MSTTDDDVKQSWLPMFVIGMGQTQMSLNINALPVSIGGIVAEFNVAPTTVGTAIVAYSLGVAGFIMLGAKLGQMFGSLKVFRAATLALLIAVALVTFAPNATVLILAQLMAGLAASVIVPTLVVLIANNYRGKQQATCLGMLGSVQAAATVTAFFMAGVIGDLFSWRYAFGLVIPFTALTLLLSFKLKPVPPLPGTKIDMVGVVLAASAIILISFGFNNLNRWGLTLSGPNAPFSILGLSPAPVMIVVGVIAMQLFVAWTQRRQAAKLTPLLSLEVLDSRQERGAAFAMAMIVILGNAMTFLSPLYIQMVQGRSSFDTAVAMIPYQLAVFTAAMLVVRFYQSHTPQQIARYSFALVAVGMAILAFVMFNEWSNLLVVLGLVTVGLGQGALVTLLFNVLVTSSPKELAGDVGALRGTVNNLSAGVGTAIAGALAVGFLSANIKQAVVDHPELPPSLVAQVDLNNATFVNNERLEATLARTTATPEQVKAAAQVNAEARLRALKLTFLILSMIALLMIVPVRMLPAYRPGEVPPGPQPQPQSGGKPA